MTASCTEMRPLQMLYAWSIFCILDTSITSQISHQIWPQRSMSSTIHCLELWIINCKPSVIRCVGYWHGQLLLNWHWLVVLVSGQQGTATCFERSVERWQLLWQVDLPFYFSFLCFLFVNKVLYHKKTPCYSVETCVQLWSLLLRHTVVWLTFSETVSI